MENTAQRYLPPDFNLKHYAPLGLLEQGHIDVWLRHRNKLLKAKAKDTAVECEASKLITLGVVGTALVMSANPLMWAPLAIGAGGYVWTVFQEYQDIGSIRPIPMYRGKIGDILTWFEGKQPEQRRAIQDDIEYLSNEEKSEALLLNYMFLELSEILSSAPPLVRFDLYRHMVSQYYARMDLVTLEEAAKYLELSVGTDRKRSLAELAADHAQQQLAESAPKQLPEESLPIVKATEGTIEPPEAEIVPPTQPPEDYEEIEGDEEPQTKRSDPKLLNSDDSVELFDWHRFHQKPDEFAHIRIIGGTGGGKTFLADWLLDVLGGDRFVITPKQKLFNWKGLKVYGLWFDYETIRAKLALVHREMHHRYPQMAAGQQFKLTNFVVDEWRLINLNVKAVRQRDPETKQMIEVHPSAKALMRDIITVAREAMFRLVALAQGEGAETWGLEGEADLEECFCDIRLGEFAIDFATAKFNNQKQGTPGWSYWAAVLKELKRQEQRVGKNGKPIACCLVGGKWPAEIPDLSDWSRDVNSNEPTFIKTEQTSKVIEQIENDREPANKGSELKVSNFLAEPLKTIWLFAKEQGDWVTVREVQRKDFAALKKKGSKQIHQLLGLLADNGYGEIDEEGKTCSSVRFRAY